MSMKEESYDYDDENNFVELVDENGDSHRYEHVGTIEYRGEWYCFFTNPEDAEEVCEDEEDAGEEVVVFRLVGDEDNETLEIVTDDKLLDEVFAEFCNQYGNSEDADEAAALEPDEE